MSRYHYWQFLINSEGQPIPDANISVHLAGTNTPANVYFDEFGYSRSNEIPQVITNNMGYFEFWVGDASEEFGYVKGQKFKLTWEKPGVALGEIDWIDIFPHVIEVDETDPTSITKNKVINNRLAYRWEEHRNYTVQDKGYPIHGIEAVNEFDTDTFPNKVISNAFAKQLFDHSESTYELYPHDIQPVNGLLTDDIFNKLISNKILYDVNTSLITIQDNLDILNNKVIEMGNAGNIFLPHALNDIWVLNHNFGVKYVSVTIYGPDDKEITPVDVELLNFNTVTVKFEEPVQGYAVITGNVIENTPSTPFIVEGDHGSLTGLLGDDHTQYILVDGTRGFTNTVSGVDPVDYNDLATKYYVDNVNLTHSSLLNSFIGDDHIQYVHIDGRRGFINPIKGELPIDPEHLTTKSYVDNILYTLLNSSDWIVKTSSFSAYVREKYIVDTSTGSIMVVLPPTANNGESIKFIDGAGFNINSLTIDRNGNTIEGVADNMIVNTTSNKAFELIFYNNNWILA